MVKIFQWVFSGEAPEHVYHAVVMLFIMVFGLILFGSVWVLVATNWWPLILLGWFSTPLVIILSAYNKREKNK